MNDVFARGWLNADEYGDIKAPHLFVEAGQLMARRVVESGYRCQPMRGWEVESGFWVWSQISGRRVPKVKLLEESDG